MEAGNLRTWKIESGSTAIGIPDMHWIGRSTGSSGWAELKFSREQPHRATYERGQSDWLLNYWASGGIAWTAIHVESTQTVILVPGNLSKAAERSLSNIYEDITEVHLRSPGAWERIINTITGRE
jgi:hypothetical protein